MSISAGQLFSFLNRRDAAGAEFLSAHLRRFAAFCGGGIEKVIAFCCSPRHKSERVDS
jgi:hypothetical protein